MSEPTRGEQAPEVQDFEKRQVQTDAEKDPSTTSSQDHAGDAPKQPVNPWADPSSFPDGGTKAWLTVAGASACFFVSWGWINCIGVFQDYFMRGEKTQIIT